MGSLVQLSRRFFSKKLSRKVIDRIRYVDKLILHICAVLYEAIGTGN
jgi:hypothetical protein